MQILFLIVGFRHHLVRRVLHPACISRLLAFPLPVFTVSVCKRQVRPVAVSHVGRVPPSLINIMRSITVRSYPPFIEKNSPPLCLVNLGHIVNPHSIILSSGSGDTIHRIDYGVSPHLAANACRALVKF